jgi:hypothetical protein
LELRGSFPEALCGKGIALFNKGLFIEALGYFDSSIK